MPVVLATAEGAEQSGYTYDDRTGVSYEFPNRYLKLLQPGDQFVYHMPKRGYTGMGIIGAVAASSRPAHWVCEILDYQQFVEDVPLRAPNGVYHEAKPAENILNVYWSQGVRPLSVEAFEAIVGMAAGANSASGGSGGYASPGVASAVEQFSVAKAKEWLSEKFAGLPVLEMPHNNPGFDLVVGTLSAPVKYVEVKGTQSARATFWMSEGERKYSLANASHYMLIVVSGVDLSGNGPCEVRVHEGAVGGASFELEPSQWRGLLK